MADQSQYRPTVLAGPSGVGKGTIASLARDRDPRVWLSLSATTRPPRAGEKPGVHYHFVADAEFDAMVAAGDMLEWALVHGQHRYGTPRAPLEKALAEGRAPLLEIDLQGARQVKTTLPTARFVFLLPPSWQVLKERLAGRATEDQAAQSRRLQTAKVEMDAADEFEFHIVNDEAERAAAELLAVMGLTTQ